MPTTPPAPSQHVLSSSFQPALSLAAHTSNKRLADFNASASSGSKHQRMTNTPLEVLASIVRAEDSAALAGGSAAAGAGAGASAPPPAPFTKGLLKQAPVGKAAKAPKAPRTCDKNDCRWGRYKMRIPLNGNSGKCFCALTLDDEKKPETVKKIKGACPPDVHQVRREAYGAYDPLPRSLVRRQDRRGSPVQRRPGRVEELELRPTAAMEGGPQIPLPKPDRGGEG